ncbi:hypothetical protein QWY31_15810 [Cytophagales bacterium LB-30]|uniref:DUF485 domain-containing protein n=1 Tax=Shiella aurantiaca TaxID=3058365 RepID=A0ABT8F918_9BACT|nr:hypothetical protein [Shiella aurantiaca]MDN4166977.1 hypothetical protein [Shiella aurantiaca]
MSEKLSPEEIAPNAEKGRQFQESTDLKFLDSWKEKRETGAFKFIVGKALLFGLPFAVMLQMMFQEGESRLIKMDAALGQKALITVLISGIWAFWVWHSNEKRYKATQEKYPKEKR